MTGNQWLTESLQKHNVNSGSSSNTYLNLFLCLVVRSCQSQIRLVQTLSLDSVWGQSPPTELLSWVTSCPKGDREGAPLTVGGERLEVRGQGCFLRFQSLLEAEVVGSQWVAWL